MNSRPHVQLPRMYSDYLPLDGRSRRICRITTLAVPVGTSFVSATEAVPSGMVLVITRIVGKVEGRGATSLTEGVTFRITDGTYTQDLVVKVPGLVNTEPNKPMIDLQPGNCFALGYNNKLQIKVSNAGLHFCPTVYGYWLTREEARTLGVEPVVLSDSIGTFAGNGFVACSAPGDTSASVFVQAKQNKSIQIEWIYISGYAADASNAQDILAEFTDGDLTFYKLLRVYNKSAATVGTEYLQAQIPDGLNGPLGLSLQATLSKADTFSIIVGGKYVGKTSTTDPTGVHTGPPAPAGKKFWFFAENTNVTTTASSHVFASNTATTVGLPQIAHIRGVCFSISKGTGTAPGGMGLCAGTDTTSAVGPAVTVATGTNGTSKETGTVSMLQGELDVPMAIGPSTQSIYVNSIVGDGAAKVAALVWGRLRPSSEFTQITTTSITPLDRIYRQIS